MKRATVLGRLRPISSLLLPASTRYNNKNIVSRHGNIFSPLYSNNYGTETEVDSDNILNAAPFSEFQPKSDDTSFSLTWDPPELDKEDELDDAILALRPTPSSVTPGVIPVSDLGMPDTFTSRNANIVRNIILQTRKAFLKGDFREGLQRYEDLKDDGLIAPGYLFHTIIASYLKYERYQEGIGFWNKEVRPRWSKDINSYNLILSLYLKVNNFEAVIKLRKEIEDTNALLNPTYWNILLFTYAAVQDFEKTMEVMEHIKQEEPIVRPLHYTLMFRSIPNYNSLGSAEDLINHRDLQKKRIFDIAKELLTSHDDCVEAWLESVKKLIELEFYQEAEMILFDKVIKKYKEYTQDHINHAPLFPARSRINFYVSLFIKYFAEKNDFERMNQYFEILVDTLGVNEVKPYVGVYVFSQIQSYVTNEQVERAVFGPLLDVVIHIAKKPFLEDNVGYPTKSWEKVWEAFIHRASILIKTVEEDKDVDIDEIQEQSDILQDRFAALWDYSWRIMHNYPSVSVCATIVDFYREVDKLKLVMKPKLTKRGGFDVENVRVLEALMMINGVANRDIDNWSGRSDAPVPSTTRRNRLHS